MTRRRIVQTVGAGALAVLTTTQVVLAQTPVQLPEDEKSWLKWAIAAGLAVVVSAAGFLTLKKSNQG